MTNPYLNDKPNGGALTPEATMGRSQYVPMMRKYPQSGFLDRLPRDELADLDIPDDVDPDDLERAYLVGLRVVEKTWANSHESYPLLRAYYATADAAQIYRIQTSKGIETNTENGGYSLTHEVKEKIRSSILTAQKGEPTPHSWEDYSSEQVREQYRRVLADEHGLPSATSAGGDPNRGEA